MSFNVVGLNPAKKTSNKCTLNAPFFSRKSLETEGLAEVLLATQIS